MYMCHTKLTAQQHTDTSVGSSDPLRSKKTLATLTNFTDRLKNTLRGGSRSGRWVYVVESAGFGSGSARIMSCCLLDFGRVQELRQVREFLFPKHNSAGPEEEKTQAGTAGVSMCVYVT